MPTARGERVPDLFGPELKARSLGLLLITAGALAVLTLILPHSEAIRDLPLIAGATATVIVGLIVGLLVPSDRALLALLALTTILIAGCNYVVAGTVVYPITFTWTSLFAFAFLGRRVALVQSAAVGVLYAGLLAIEEPASPVTRWVIVVGTPVVAGMMITSVLGRLSYAIARADERAEVIGQSEARTRAIVDAAADAFMTVDTEGVVLSWNSAAEQMFGLPAAAAVGRPVVDLIFRDDPAERAMHDHRRRRLASLPAGSASEVYELALMRPDGTDFPAEVSAAPILAGDDKLLAVFIRDVTERGEREQAQASLLLEQRAREEAERLAGIVQGLQRLVDAALAHRKLDDVLDGLLPRLCEVLDGDAAAVLLSDAGGGLVLHAATGGLGAGEPLRVAIGEGIAGRAAERGEAVLVHDPPPEEVLPALRAARSILTVPLMAGITATGVIQVAVSPPRRFGDDDLTVLGLAADRVALAIDHARVYEREHKIAETLQRSLLPEQLPKLPGLEVAARYLPAAAEAEVGGDWYDVIPIDSGRIGLVMGDVVGKGLAAASLVGRLRSALRAYALEGHDAAEVVERVNQLLWSEAGDSDMATLIYLVVDLGVGTLSWVNAGHLPPIVSDDGSSRLLEGPSSVPLGVMPFPGYEQGSMPLAGGASVLLYTDGLIERPGELLDRGLERLRAIVGERDPEALCDHVLKTLVPSGAASDDVALLALQLSGLPETFELSLPADPGELAALRALLRRWLADAEIGDREGAEILAAAGEAAANAIEHGSDGDGAAFDVLGTTAGDSVEIVVRDHGGWVEQTESEGRGLVLMRSLMDAVEIETGTDGTTVRMQRGLRERGRGS